MAIIRGSNRYNNITTANNGDILELGPGGTTTEAGTMEIQFAPSVDFAGSFQVLGKIQGQAALNAPFVPIPYRRVNLSPGNVNQAGDLLTVADPVIPTAIIRVPSCTLSVALLITCTLGSCQIFSMDIMGSSAP